MAFVQIATNTDTMKSDIDKLNAYLAQASGELNDMFEAIKELSGTWSGTAHDEFDTQFTADYNAGTELCKTVQDIINCVDFAKGEYVKCETQVADIISAIAI